jgi:hypothetical protein
MNMQTKALLLIIISLLLSSGMASADTITLTGTCSSGLINATNDHIAFNLSNSGNGTATNILLIPQLSGASTYNGTVSANILPPDGSVLFSVPLSNFSYPGDYAENFLIEYDQGSSQFIALFPCLVPIIRGSQSPVIAEGISNSGGHAYNATLIDPSSAVNATVQIIVPQELVANPTSINVHISPSKPSTINFNVSPIQSLVGSFTSAIETSYVLNGVHYASLQTFAVTIGSSGSNGSGDLLLIFIAVIVAALIALIIASAVRGRKPTTEAKQE